MSRRLFPPPSSILLLALLPIGDTLLIEPTVRVIRARYPGARIVALGRSAAAPLLGCLPSIDEVLVLPLGPDWSGVGPLVRTVREIRARRFDVAIDFTSPAYKWISFLGGTPRRTYMKFDRLWWLLPRAHRRWRATHATEHYYACARELDLPPWDVVDHAPRLALPDAARVAATAWLERSRRRDGAPLVGLHPGGAGLRGLKRWPPTCFAELATQLRREWGAECLLLGGPNEAELAADVAAAMPDPPLSAVGRVSLLTSSGLIAACDLLIGNDSALLHAAAALGTPYVGIFGPTSPASFRPVPARPAQGLVVQPWPRCPEPRSFVGSDLVWSRPRCRGCCAALATLPVSKVLSAAEGLLAARRPRTDAA
jgi:lipopolysaccharide heptosyltransferase II